MRKLFCAALSVAVLFAASVSTEAAQYRILDLGLGQANGINGNGLVVGTNGIDAVSWDSSGLHDLGIKGAAYAVNDSGVIVGAGNVATNKQGFVWYSVSRVQSTLGVVYDINSQGQIAESSTDWHSPSWFGINDQGTKVGYEERLYGSSEASYFPFAISSLGNLPNNQGYWAYKINHSGLIIGQCGNWWSCLWDSTGRHDFANGFSGQDISNSGCVAGYRATSANQWGLCTPMACYWDGTEYIDLGTLLGGTESSAAAINDNGWIVGWSNDASGNQHAVLWEPVPEPSSILALLCGISGLSGILLRRRFS